MLKTSSLVSVVQYTEVLRAAENIGSDTTAVMEMLFVASIWYLVLTTVFSVFQYYIERYFARGSSRSLPDTPLQRVRRNLTTFRHSTGSGAKA
jgi:polar amino acid transport system permease protein